MAHRKLDGVQQLATGTGIGALTLGAATQAYYRTMQAAGATNTDTLFVRIQHETIAAEWEQVLATYNAGAITRTFDSNSTSATGALISFSAGNKIVSCVLRAGDAVAMDNNGDASVARNLTLGGIIASAMRFAPMVIQSATSFTVGANDVVTLSNNAATVTATLPDASLETGTRLLFFQNKQASLLISASANVVSMPGISGSTAILPATDGAWCILASRSSNGFWYIIASGV